MSGIEHIYIHIPFCISKCPYCDFFSVTPGKRSDTGEYVDLLIKEIGICSTIISRKIKTLYFGGGTPSLLTPGQVSKLTGIFGFETGAEVTLEINPGTVSADQLRKYRSAGINRLSIGAQSFIGRELKILGRSHTVKDIISTFAGARKAGFDNISLDIISSLPGQTPASVLYSVNKSLSLLPEHISMYMLTFYEGTSFYRKMVNGHIKPQEDDLSAELYDIAASSIIERGYERYEISNFSLKGKRSRHNVNTWDMGEYLGLGASAHSFFSKKRWSNPDHLEKYRENITGSRNLYSKIMPENITELKNDFIMLALRTSEGISSLKYEEFFNASFEHDTAENLTRMLKTGFIKKDKGYYRIPEEKFSLYNSVVTELLI